jgi:hypothetical protein
MKNLTKHGKEKKSNAGRPQIYIDDIGVILSVQVPSKQKEIIRKMVLAFRKQFLIVK